MNRTLTALLLAPLFAFPLQAEDHGELIFSDDFERSESQEVKDEPGNGWGTNSRTRAQGNKQVDLKDGTLRIYLHEAADHAVSVTHPFAFTDGSVGLKFLLEDEKDSLGLNFADLDEKSVHAGHLFVAKVKPGQLQIQDLKHGNMNLATREARLNQTLSPEQKTLVAGKTKDFPASVETGKWHDLLVTISGDSLSVKIDGNEAGQFRSEGFAHPTKRLLRLAVPRNAVVDEVRIWRKN